MVSVKVIDDKGFIQQGSIGIGFGAWTRAASIRDQIDLSDFPQSVTQKKWDSLNAPVVEVDTSIPWREVQKSKAADSSPSKK